MELILQDIELAENTLNDNVFDIFFNERTRIFIAQEVDGVRTFRYKLLKEVEELTEEERHEILKYRLGEVTPEDVVTIGDIFMFGKFTENIL